MKKWIVILLLSGIAFVYGSITVLYPNGAENFKRGAEIDIRWSTSSIDTLETVKIILLSNGVESLVIADSTENDGQFSYFLPFGTFGSQFKVKVTSNSNTDTDSSDNNFNIVKGLINITAPATSNKILLNTEYEIQWQSDIPENVIIELYKGTTLKAKFVAPQKGYCKWNFYNDQIVSGRDYKLKITSMLFDDVYGETGTFSIKGTNNISGSVNGIWSELYSPYVLVDSTYISPGSTLTISPGVTVCSNGSVKDLVVKGKLSAAGTYNNKIYFDDISLVFDNASSTDTSKVIYTSLFKQNPVFTKVYESFGGGSSIEQTRDGGYIITGSGLIKTDKYGNILWNNPYGGVKVTQTKDGGFITSGETTVSFQGTNLNIIKTDDDGEIEWNYNYGGEFNDGSRSVIRQTSDGGYICACATQLSYQGKSDIWLIKISNAGEIIWHKRYGGSITEYPYDVEQTFDGGYIISGLTNSFGAGYADVWLVKTDSMGNLIWGKTFGGPETEYSKNVVQLEDGGFMILSSTRSFGAGSSDLWLIKTDLYGNKIWDKTFGTEDLETTEWMKQTKDGGFIILGLNQSNWGTIMLKTDKDGNKEWYKFVDVDGEEEMVSLDVKTNGGIIATGYTYNPGGPKMVLHSIDNYGNLDNPHPATVNSNSKIVIQNSSFKDYDDFALSVNNSQPVVSNSLITGNGSGVQFTDSSPQYFINNTIADNDSTGIFFEGNSDPRIMNNIIYGNGKNQVHIDSDDSDPNFFYNDIQGGQQGFTLNTGVTFSGIYQNNKDADPHYADGTYELRGFSQCNNAGQPGLTQVTLGTLYIPATDMAGNGRLFGNIDIGCYECYEVIVTPDSPTNVVISVISNVLNINWDDMANANSYLIYSSNNPYGTFELEGTVGENTWSKVIDTDTKKFYYVVASTYALKDQTYEKHIILPKK